jgi:hypothetical protein
MTVTVLCVLLLWVANAGAASVKMRYNYKPGESYKISEKNHDVSKSITEMSIMGQTNKTVTPMDRVSQTSYVLKVVGKEGGGVKVTTTYGKHVGGQRWSAEKMDASAMDMFAKSSAVAIIHPTDGAVKVTASPAGDQIIDMIYHGRFIWMPELPEGSVKKGSDFTHEYVLKFGMYNIKTTDEYFVADVKDDLVYLDVETRSLSVIKMAEAPGMENMPPGMGLNMSDMKLAYKGEGTAIFDVKEGVFVEREGKLSYSNLDSTKGGAAMPGGMAFKSKMEGVMKYSMEMERE